MNLSPEPIDATFRLVDAPSIRQATPMFGSKPAQLDAEAKKIAVTMEGKSTATFAIEP